MKKLLAPIFLLILVASIGLRLPQLTKRPMHHDEANQAARFGILLETGKYQYDPEDHHGPTLYYLEHLAQKRDVDGTTEYLDMEGNLLTTISVHC